MKAETDVRVSEPDAGAVEQFAADLATPATATEASAPKRKRGRPRGATKDPERSERAKRMWENRRAKAAGDTPGEPAPDAPVEITRAPLTQAELEQSVKEISPLLQMAGAELLDGSFPERPYTDQDAEQLATGLVPVLHKHASFLQAYSAEMALVMVVLIQANSYRKIIRERNRQAHFEQQSKPDSVIPVARADESSFAYRGPNRFRENNAS